MTKMFVPLAEVSREKLLELKRDNFSDDEWDELDDDVREQIAEGDEAHQARIANMVKQFVDRWKWSAEPDTREAAQEAEAYFDYFIQEEDLLKAAEEGGFDVEELIANWEANGYARETVVGALTEVLRDTNVYGEFEYNNSESYRRPKYMFVTQLRDGNIYFDRSDMNEILEGMHEDEILEALEQIEKETYLNIPRKELEGKYEFDYHFDRDGWIVCDPDWDKVQKALTDALEEVEPDAPEVAEDQEKRVIHRYKDGSYVLDLTAGELLAEGQALGHCVGRADMGYTKALRGKEIKIFSLRTQAGRPKFTIEADLDRSGKISAITQIKGKSNRLPGWDFGKTSVGSVKKDEVDKIVELFKTAPILRHIKLESIRDLRPALEHTTSTSWRTVESLPGNVPRENPRTPACPMGDDHGKCTGFCQPYRSRR
jgi:hypothetical protein